MIDRLKKDLETLKGQEREYLGLLRSTQGAIQYVEYLISAVDSESLSLDEFAKMVAGEGAKAYIHESERVNTGCVPGNREGGGGTVD